MSNTSRSRASTRGKHGAGRTTPPSTARSGGTQVEGRGQGVSALEAHLGYWLRFVSNHVSHAFKVKVEQHGVTVAEWVVMRALFDEEGIKPSAISEKLGLTRGAISKLLHRLATKDLVVVRGDAQDGRAQVVSLSASGRRLVPKLAAVADNNDAEAFGHLSAKQRATMLRTLESIVDRLGLSGAPVD